MDVVSGINHWAMPDLAVREAAALAKQAGFAAIELNLAEDGELGLQTSTVAAHALCAAVEGVGLQLGGLSTNLYWRYSPTADDPAIRQRAREIAARQLELGAALGVDAILVVPGQVGAAMGGPSVRYDVAYERAQEFLGALAPVAERAGVTLAIENVWNKFLLSPLEMRRLIDEIGSERVGVYFDVGNILLYGYPEHWIDILGARIRRVHLKDYARSIGGLQGFVDLGAGDVDWETVGAALNRAGYRGPLTAEVFPSQEERGDPSGYVTKIGQQIAAVLARIKQGVASP
ncbi:MAG TPA: sugar phosphate isomerase/epimerase family protein [Thermomicrobiales bacterium]|jgi:hexulose-6-phosphate isomerase